MFQVSFQSIRYSVSIGEENLTFNTPLVKNKFLSLFKIKMLENLT